MPWIHESSKICFFFRHLTPWLGTAMTAMTAMTFWGDKCHVHDPCSWPCWGRAESLGVAPPAGAQWEVPLAIGTHRNSKWNSKWAHSESILSPFSSFIYSIYDFNSSLVYFGFIAFKFNVKALQLLPRQIDTTTYNCALEAPCFFFPKDWRVLGPVPIHGDFQPGLCGRRRPPQCRHVAAANGQGGACGCGLVQYAQCLEFWGWFQSQEWIESWPIFAEVHKTTSARTPAQRGSQNLAGAPQHGVEICWDCHHFAFRLYFADFAAYFQKWLCFPLE